MNERRGDPEAQLDPGLARDLRRLSERGCEPQRDLWPEIREEIEPPKRAAGTSWWVRLAAAALLLLGFGSVAWLLSQQPAGQGLELARSKADLPERSSVELRAIFTRYLEQREQLLQLVAPALEGYPPELRGDIRRNIAVIEGAMQEIEGSLAELPDAPGAELQLAALYDRELRLLHDLNARLRGDYSE